MNSISLNHVVKRHIFITVLVLVLATQLLLAIIFGYYGHNVSENRRDVYIGRWLEYVDDNLKSAISVLESDLNEIVMTTDEIISNDNVIYPRIKSVDAIDLEDNWYVNSEKKELYYVKSGVRITVDLNLMLESFYKIIGDQYEVMIVDENDKIISVRGELIKTVSENNPSDEVIFMSESCIESTNWKVKHLVEKSKTIVPLLKIEETINKRLIIALAILVMVDVLSIIVINRIAHKLSRKLSQPIESMTERIQTYSSNPETIFDATNYSIQELQVLSDAFIQMTSQLNETKEALDCVASKHAIQANQLRLLNDYSYKDALTGLYNRRGLEMELMCISKPTTFIMLDIDFFKTVNDSYGHAEGDLVLKRLATLLKAHTRVGDILARWGGEEFIIICHLSSMTEACSLAEKLRVIIEDNELLHQEKITASFGVAEFRDEDTFDEFFKKLDFALYRAKANGRNRVESAIS